MAVYKEQLEKARKALLDSRSAFATPAADAQAARSAEGLMRPRRKPQVESSSGGGGFGMALMSAMRSPDGSESSGGGGLLGGILGGGSSEGGGLLGGNGILSGGEDPVVRSEVGSNTNPGSGKDTHNLKQFAVGGAALRSDSFTGLNAEFATGVYGLTQAAQEAGIDLKITSAYRSPAVQADIIERGMSKYGLGGRSGEWRADVSSMGPEAAGRKWRPVMRSAGLTKFIAMPGTSQHQRGNAVDFAGANGRLVRDPNSREARFIRSNADRFGLSVPMSWEPWQVERIGSRG